MTNKQVEMAQLIVNSFQRNTGRVVKVSRGQSPLEVILTLSDGSQVRPNGYLATEILNV